MTLSHYVQSFTHLRTDRVPGRWPAATRHRAPHKPLLLLSVIDLFAQGSIATNLIEITPELGELFSVYWRRVMPGEQRGNIALPFFHLKSDGFWHLVPQPGNESILAALRQIRTTSQLRETVLGARIDEELFEILCTDAGRRRLQAEIIATYFEAGVEAQLREQAVINVQAHEYSQVLLEQARNGQINEEPASIADYQPAVRDQGFRRAIVRAYEHRCAVCGVRVLTPDGRSAVDAAHIIPWSIGHNDDPRNGMALCRLCHWAFDEGMLGVSARYIVLVSPQLMAHSNVPGHLQTVTQRGIIGPAEERLWPDLQALGWHLRNVFQAR